VFLSSSSFLLISGFCPGILPLHVVPPNQFRRYSTSSDFGASTKTETQWPTPSHTSSDFGASTKTETQWPTPSSTPSEILLSQLHHVNSNNLWSAFALYSRSRRFQLEEEACPFPLNKIPQKVREAVARSFPSSIFPFDTCEVISSLTIERGEGPERGRRLARKGFRVRFYPSGLVAYVSCTRQTEGSYAYNLATDDWAEFQSCPSFIGCFLIDEIFLEEGGTKVKEVEPLILA